MKRQHDWSEVCPWFLTFLEGEDQERSPDRVQGEDNVQIADAVAFLDGHCFQHLSLHWVVFHYSDLCSFPVDPVTTSLCMHRYAILIISLHHIPVLLQSHPQVASSFPDIYNSAVCAWDLVDHSFISSSGDLRLHFHQHLSSLSMTMSLLLP